MVKIWFEHTYIEPEWDMDHFALAVGGYRHARSHPWKGFTLILKLFNREIMLNYVNNFKAYDEVINRKVSRFKSRNKK